MMPTRNYFALLLTLPLLVVAVCSHAGEQRELNLNTSHGELGLGGIKQWDFRLSMDAMVAEDETPMQDRPGASPGANLNVDRFLLSGQTGGFSLRVGHHQPARQGLLFDGNTDWGLSASGDLDALNSQLSVFAVSGGNAPTTPSEMKLSGDKPYYTGGVWRSALPLPGAAGTTLWAGYVNSSDMGPRTGYVSGIHASLQYRLGYSVGMKSAWLGNRLNLELEQATSRFSMEGNEGNASDHAHLASLSYQPETCLPFLDCVVGAEARDVGGAFYSPGNQSMARARAFERMYLNLELLDIGALGYNYRELDVGYGPYKLSSHGNEVFANLSLSPWDWLSLQPYGRFQRRHYKTLDTTGHQSLFRLTADAWLIPDQLVYRNTIKVTRSHGPDHSFHMRDRRHQHIGGELQWQALSPTHNRSGLDVNLRFSADRHESDFNPGGGLDDYRVLLSISSNGDGASRIW
ncbi:MAG: hypothetical protein ACQERE_11750 [Pseudomonadota bacterium]